MKNLSSGKTRGSHPHYRRKKKKEKKKKKYVKFPNHLKEQRKTVSEQLNHKIIDNV